MRFGRSTARVWMQAMAHSPGAACGTAVLPTRGPGQPASPGADSWTVL